MTTVTTSGGADTRGASGGPPLPEPRGPLSAAVTALLTGGGRTPPALPDVRDAEAADPYGDDVQLALYIAYELHYRGFAGVGDHWEWDPDLLRLRQALEQRFLSALRDDARPAGPAAETLDALLVEPVDGDGVSHRLQHGGELWQLREYAAHRSLYHLKEADPHAWVLPRLEGRAKAAMVAVEFDEFGGGRAERVHAHLFAELMTDLGLDPAYGRYLDVVPAPMLAVVNQMSLFGLHRSLRGALVGHFATVEITSSPGSRRLAKALERAGAGPAAVHFYTEHVEADAVHEQIVRHDVVGDLLEREPALDADLAFGVTSTEYLEERLGAHLLGAWDAGRTSLRRPLPAPPAD
ncbi:iron-containing redox enzyme family protein [Streptomyces zingiberis]|uniref:Iron-containing redox enzyme family protein n=1 Tax=Streptomyces zingiberis TaxID=2053010 RepID=A0ABX1C894_9ACTN|nr:iron-containing redox enzyme family protein [Streptomyces zingiberis]NJQ03939.1 iron-containing redox enzyme family protein [Streptomyces zingiberis]